MPGRCYLELGQPDRAIPLLTGALTGYDERQTRESALYTSWLAEAHVQAGDIGMPRRLRSARWNYPVRPVTHVAMTE
jgi:hypothetical protein